MPVTAKDIARELGLSQPTVSRILSGKDGHRVAAATRDRVLDAARRLEYQPNAVARSLRHGRTHCVGLYTPYDYDARNDFLSAVIGGLQRACQQNHFDLMLFAAFGDGSTQEIYGKLSDGRIDGLFLHAGQGDALVQCLVQSSLHVVAIADSVPGLPSVVCDNAGGMSQIIDYLLARGHHKFVYLAPEVLLDSVEKRRQAFENELLARGVSTAQAQVWRIEYEQTGPALQRILAEDAGPVAVCCWNDRTAYDLLQRCAQHGVPVPEKIAVVGFDGFLDTKLPSRRLVTVQCPWDAVTQAAMTVMNTQIREEDVASEVCLPVRLVPGDTA
jgi:DNA-binding LacI/PurR family transcriptional regulator